jgi:hypothetical protein
MSVAKNHAFGWRLRSVAAAVLLLVASAAPVLAQNVPAAPPSVLVQWPDTIYTNGRIITFDDTAVNNNPGKIAEALAVRAGIIIAIGSAKEIATLKGEKTKVIDLQGKTMMPAFVHSHNHIQGPAEQKAYELFNLPELTPGYYLDTGVEWTSKEILAKIKAAVDQLRAKADVTKSEWIGIKLFEDPEKGFPTIATASQLMGSWVDADAEIKKADIDEIVPDRMFELTVAASVQDRPRRGHKRNVWYKLSAGENGAPVWKEFMDFTWEPWVYDQPVAKRQAIETKD